MSFELAQIASGPADSSDAALDIGWQTWNSGVVVSAIRDVVPHGGNVDLVFIVVFHTRARFVSWSKSSGSIILQT